MPLDLALMTEAAGLLVAVVVEEEGEVVGLIEGEGEEDTNTPRPLTLLQVLQRRYN